MVFSCSAYTLYVYAYGYILTWIQVDTVTYLYFIDGIAANKNEVTDQSAGGCTNTDGLPSRDGPRTSTRSTARDGHASRGILRVSSGEGGTNKDGQTSKTGQSSKDGRTSGVQFTDMSPEEAGDGSLPAQSLPGTNSGSSITGEAFVRRSSYRSTDKICLHFKGIGNGCYLWLNGWYSLCMHFISICLPEIVFLFFFFFSFFGSSAGTSSFFNSL